MVESFKQEVPHAELSALFMRAWGSSLSALCEPRFELENEPAPQQAEVARAATSANEQNIADELASWLEAHNQFLVLDPTARDELRASVRRALFALQTGEQLAAVFAGHRAELCAFLRARLGPTPRDVVSAEYSPETQLGVLGLSLDAHNAPVLDVGCGSSAALVRHLLGRGVAARGVDRSAPLDVATRADWLAFDYGSERHRTVLSHLGFSLHFLHHHLAARDVSYDYARVFMAILRSLVRGGVFAYTPALPFFEPLLDATRYRVRTVPLSSSLRPSNLGELERETGLALGSATHVERIA